MAVEAAISLLVHSQHLSLELAVLLTVLGSQYFPEPIINQ